MGAGSMKGPQVVRHDDVVSHGTVKCQACFSRVPLGTSYKQVLCVHYSKFETWSLCSICASVLEIVMRRRALPAEGPAADDYPEWALDAVRSNTEDAMVATAWLATKAPKLLEQERLNDSGN